MIIFVAVLIASSEEALRAGAALVASRSSVTVSVKGSEGSGLIGQFVAEDEYLYEEPQEAELLVCEVGEPELGHFGRHRRRPRQDDYG